MNSRHYIIFTFVLAALVACKDDVVPDWEPAEALSVTSADGTLFSRFASYESLAVSIEGKAAADSVIMVSSDADWLTVESARLPADGILSLATTNNEGNTRREATLIFTAANGRQAQLAVSQQGMADDVNNGDPRSDGYLGYGYDIYQRLDNPMSVRKTCPVLALDALRSFSAQHTYEVVHDCRLSRTDVNVYAARTASEFSQQLTSSASNTDVLLMGCRQDCEQAEAVSHETNIMLSNMAYGCMEKAVWSRTIDKGALLNLRDRGRDFFSPMFQRDLLRVTGQVGAARAQALERLLDKYGTHIVMQADYGGKITFTFTMSKMGSVQHTEEAREQAEFTFGRLPKATCTDEHSSAISSSKRADGAIQVQGGSPAARAQLRADIRAMGDNDQLNPEHLLEWLSSINYSNHPGTDENLEIIHFDLLPLWELFTGDLRMEVLSAVIKRASKSNCQVRDASLQTDLYWLPVDGIDTGTSASGGELKSLSRIYYVKGVPVLNVCSEYVPQIRSDRRITVAYPIWENRIQLTQGLFVGDGTHRPAYLMFGQRTCHVVPIDTLSASTILHHIAYAGGNLYPDRHGLVFQPVSPEIHDDLFLYNYAGDHYLTPVVKVGSTFWTRRDIDHDMGFTPDPDENDDIRDIVQGDALYTGFQFELFNYAAAVNAWNYGYQPDPAVKGPGNQRWFLPHPSQVEALYAYVGQNPKVLFRGQASGFEAQFHGYYGNIDIQDSNALLAGGLAHRADGVLNVIASRASADNADACLLLLDTHYRLSLIDDNTYATGSNARYWRMNYYPVRLCRGAQYQYPSLETIQQKFPEY